MSRLSDLPVAAPTADDELYLVQNGASRRARVGDLPGGDDARLTAVEAVAHSHANRAVLDATTAAFTAADRALLDGLEPGATADQTGAEIVAALDGELGDAEWRTASAFTAADRALLDGLEPGATADQTGAEIVAALDGELGDAEWRTASAFTAADRALLDGLEPGATADQTGAEIVAALDGELGDAGWRTQTSALVRSVNGATGDVALTAADVGAATAAQGALADAAVQPAALASVAFSGDFSALTGRPSSTADLANAGAGGAGEVYVVGEQVGVTRIVAVTAAAYAALTTPDPATLYVIMA